MSFIDIELDRIDRIYRPNDLVRGHIILNANSPFTHQGITMTIEGNVKLQLSAQSVGLFEAFYNSVKPMELVHFVIPIVSTEKIEKNQEYKYPFEFKLIGIDDQPLYESYHGVYVSVTYNMTCDCPRGLMKKNLTRSIEFIVEVPHEKPLPSSEENFVIVPETLENLKKNSLSQIPPFRIYGKIHRTNCPINLPFTGEIAIEHAKSKIKSIEVQLIRVESVVHEEGVAREATEIQNVQIALGDVCRDLVIPIYMIFPRLFTCPTMLTSDFKVEFETNLVVLFNDGYMITENFPIVIYR